MKDALTQRCLTDKQLGDFLSRVASSRAEKVVYEHIEHCDACWQKLELHLPKRLRDSAYESDQGDLMMQLFPPDPPKTRADCKNGPRPCPWLRCRHHLWNDEHDGVETRVLSLPIIGVHSCVLDVVDENEGGLLPTEIGKMIQRRPEEVSENLQTALDKLRGEGVFLSGDATEWTDRDE